MTFWLPPDDNVEQATGRFPLTRSEIQPTIDAAAEIETTWYEPERVDEVADRQDARIREVTGNGLAYPRHSHKHALGYRDVRGMSVGAEMGQPQPEYDPRPEIDSYNQAIKRLREITPELSDIKTTEEAEYDWLQDAQKKRQAAAEISTHSSDSLFGPASLAQLWAGVKTGIQEPANLAAMGAGVISGGAMAAPLAGARLFARLGTPVLLDSLYGAGAQYTISDRLENLRLRLDYTPEQVEEMKWTETATAFGVGAVLGGLFEGGSLAVRTMLRGSGKLGSAIDDLNSPDPATRLNAADQIERMVPLNDEEAALLAAARRDANLRLNAPVHEADLRAYLSKLEGGRKVANGSDPDRDWFIKVATMFDAESPRMTAIRRITDRADAGETVTLNEIRDVLTPAQKIAFERDLSATPTATSVREVVFDYRDLSVDGKKLFRELEKFETRTKAKDASYEEIFRTRNDLVRRIDESTDRESLMRFRDQLAGDDYRAIKTKRRISETHELTERQDMIGLWMRELRGEADDARLRVEADKLRRPATSLDRLKPQPMGIAILARRIAAQEPVQIGTPEQAQSAFTRLSAAPKANPDEVRIAPDLAAGKYDDSIRHSEADLLARFGDDEVPDPISGQARKLREVLAENEQNLRGLKDIYDCMSGLAKAGI